jgi:pimeloyl-ACP methyl ester carboxylesterase
MVQGEEDRVTPAATNAKLLAAALPHAHLVILAGSGHLPEVELPSCVNDLIKAHLNVKDR